MDRLHDAGQGWWQALPLGPTGYGNSPYQAMSSFAGNAMLISPGSLISDGLLKATDGEADFHADVVDYEAVIPFKVRLLETAWKNFKAGERKDLQSAFDEFCAQQEHWLEDYALFRALKAKYNGAYYLDWPAELVQRNKDALASARRELSSQVDQVRFAQFLLFRQADQLKQHAHSKGVRVIGDLPFFVSPDSSDVWANPEFFLLDEHRRPRFVAGVPPDYFSAQGQLWGNPVYNWDALRATGYRWSIDRLRALLSHVDAIRLDHFRGLGPRGTFPRERQRPSPDNGCRVRERPSLKLCATNWAAFRSLPKIWALLLQTYPRLRDQFQLPGTRVLQFAFDGHSDNPYQPHNFVSNTVAYTGTHDNAPTRQWYEELPDDQRQNFWSYLKRAPGPSDEAAPALMDLAWSSTAGLAIAPLQDLLNLGAESRMNVPGRAGGNWGWRCTEDKMSAPAFQWLQKLTETAKRSDHSGLPVQPTGRQSSASTQTIPA